MHSTRNIIDTVWTTYGTEIVDRTEEFQSEIDLLRTRAAAKFSNIRIAADGKTAGTVDMSDYRLLYGLVRFFKPRNIFEIGTWIGTSAMIMSEAVIKNGHGHVYTCDRNSHYSLPGKYDDIITKVNEFSDTAIDHFPGNERIDFIFADGSLNSSTVKKLINRSNERVIFVTHDYQTPDEKGVLNLILFLHFSNYRYEIVLPEKLGEPYNIESYIALLVPEKTCEELGLQKTSQIQKRVFVCTIALRYYLHRFLRRLR
jgi:hypothetical protein